jgi:ankyrin repeat protein
MKSSFSVDRPARTTQPVRASSPSQGSDASASVLAQEAPPHINRRDSPRPGSSGSDRISTTGHSSIRVPLHIRNSDTPVPIPTSKDLELGEAVLNGKAGRVKTLFSKYNVNPNIRNNDGTTLLQEAILRSHFQVSKALVENGADIHLSDNSGDTALLIAAKKRKLNEMHLLLKHGADPNQGDADGSTPLMISSEKGHEEVVQEILSQGPDRNLDADLKRERDGINAVMLAAINGRTKCPLNTGILMS